jgi:hypothetical protein
LKGNERAVVLDRCVAEPATRMVVAGSERPHGHHVDFPPDCAAQQADRSAVIMVDYGNLRAGGNHAT